MPFIRGIREIRGCSCFWDDGHQEIRLHQRRRGDQRRFRPRFVQDRLMICHHRGDDNWRRKMIERVTVDGSGSNGSNVASVEDPEISAVN